MEKEKKKNHWISVFYLSIFASALILLGSVVSNIVMTYMDNVELQKKQKELNEELNYIGDVGNDAQEGYYIVYAANDYVLEKENGEVVVVYEMK